MYNYSNSIKTNGLQKSKDNFRLLISHLLNKTKLISLFGIIIYFIIVMPVFGTEQDKNIKTALVLSGGGARGFAHIGVIKALEEMDFQPDLIVGTSMGAVIASLYACGNSSEEIEYFIKKIEWQRLFNKKSYNQIKFVSQKMGEIPMLFSLQIDNNFNIIYPRYLLSTQGLQEFLFNKVIYSEFMAGSNFDSLAIPMRIVATDIIQGKSVVFNQGNIAKIVSGSSAFPVILSPVKQDSMMLVDGGLTNNVPCDIAEENGAEFIIAVDMSSKTIKLGPEFDPLMFMGQTVNTMAYFSDTRNLDIADILIKPSVDNIFSLDFDSIEVLINKGYLETKKYMSEIKKYSNQSKKVNINYKQKSVEFLNAKTIKDIKIISNKGTKNFIIEREITFQKGDLWKEDKALESIRNLYSTGLFKTVNISLEKVDKNNVNIIFHVEEKERILVSFGMNYDSERETKALISYRHRNIFGRGLDNHIYFVGSDFYKKIAWDFNISRIFTTTLMNYVSLYQEVEKIPLYQEAEFITHGKYTRFGAETNFGFQVKRVGLTSFGVKYEYIEIPKNLAYTPKILEKKYGVGRMITRIKVDDTDNYDLPTSGHTNDIYYEHSIKGYRLKNFGKLYLSSVGYETFQEKYTFSTHIRFGYLSSALSYFEKFRLGGVNSLPGYHQDEKWGNLLMEIGFGVRAPLTSGTYFHCLGMFGNVWDNIESFNWLELILGTRVGIVVATPLGPIALDYGISIDKRELFYLSFGHHF